MSNQFQTRRATPQDRPQLSAIINQADHAFYHLDWSPPLDWLGKQPFWVAEDRLGIQAALALIEEPAKIAWLRLYVCRRGVSPDEHWRTLLNHCLSDFAPDNRPIIAALGLKEWLVPLLQDAGFQYHQSIVTLYRDLEGEEADFIIPPSIYIRPMEAEEADFIIPPSIYIRPMEAEDLPIVAVIDQLSFEPIWQNSLPQIEISYQRARYATVAEVDDQIVGFQISTSSLFSIHLARLAVHPSYMRQHIGYALVADLIQRCQRDHWFELSVNTQDNNHASLSLYQKIGFERSEQSFSVWVHHPD